MNEFSLYPHRRCIECTTIKECPWIIEHVDKIMHIEVDPECPHKDEREKELTRLKNERTHH